MVYMTRAQREPAQRERRLVEAVPYLEKAFSVDENDPVNILESGDAFEAAGDLSTRKGCAYYGRALERARQLGPSYSGDQIQWRSNHDC